MKKKLENLYYVLFNVLYNYYSVKDKFGNKHNLIVHSIAVGSFLHYINILNLMEFFASIINKKNTYWFQIIHPIYVLMGVFVFWFLNYLIFQKTKRYIILYSDYLEKTTKRERIFYDILTIIYVIFSFISIIYKPWLVWI